MTTTLETTELLVTRLYIEDVAPYKTVARLVIPQLVAGQVVWVYAESHGDPRQKDKVKQKECAWVTGIDVVGVGNVARNRGRDLYYAQKDYDCRAAAFIAPVDTVDTEVRYEMRALNKTPGGYFNISWVKLGVIILPAPATV